MTTNPSKQIFKPQSTVIEWLLDSDPSIRWQVMQDLLGAPAAEVAAERARVATTGWGAQLLALQGSDGSWAGEAWNHGWDSTMHVLTLLREMGLPPSSAEAQRALALVRDNVHWRGWDWDGSWKGLDFVGTPYFIGEVEPCINGEVAAGGAYFHQDVERIISRLLTEQLPDGGWNCDAPTDSTRSSFNTTICVLDALLEYERAFGSRPEPSRMDEVTDARLRGQEYLLARHLFRRLSTGEVIERDRKDDSVWTQFSFPNWWHYDILRGLDYMRQAHVKPDERVAEAIALVESKRDAEGKWLLENQYPGTMPIDLNETPGSPSRWLTLRALRVLKWYSAP